MVVDERTLVADIKSYIDELEGFHAEVEEHTGKKKRMDLTVYHKNQLICIAEFKRPTTIEGKTPRNYELVMDAFLKASNNKSPPRFFITSNFNETIVWDNHDTTKPVMARDIFTISLDKKIKNDNDFEKEDVIDDIKRKIKYLVNYIWDLLNGKEKAHYKPLGESFILGLNAHLESAAAVVKKHVPDKILKNWWKEQGYIPKVNFDDSDKEKISKHSLYVLANKIVFYYVLRRMFPDIAEINVDKKKTITELKKELDSCFQNAKNVSGDYETIFEENEADNIPFNHEENLEPLKALIKFLENYDFTKLPQDLIGNIYDRLIDPEERHANGQYYTPIPIVDLINALTIKKPDARVMDPACGSGTFLTRAFDLKLKLYGKDDKDTRESIIKDIFGCDIATYPAHLATVALASKLLMYNPEVYPNIIRSDFLDLKTSNIIPKLRIETTETRKYLTKSLNGELKTVSFKPIDAFVGNLPYIRQEDIPNKEAEREKIEKFLRENGFADDRKENEEYLYKPDKSADFHVYFWYYLLPILKEGSMVGFLTSDTWMNVEYGYGFKKFLNRYFKIKYIIDSSVERWFEDAMVNTVITILERTDNKEDRRSNKVRFIRFDKKISDIIGGIDDAVKIAKSIEAGKSVDGVRIVREIEQGDINLDDIMKSKLFPYLRAPDEFFELVNNKNMIPLKNVMNVQFGIKTGANEFFYVEDVTDEYSDEDLRKFFDLRTGEKKRIRVVKDGLGVVHLIEAKYLKPILKSPKEFTLHGKLLFNEPTKKYVVLIEETDKNKIEKHALEYIEYGEKNPPGEPYSERQTCKSRNPWWKLTPIIYPDIAFTMYFSSNFIFPKTNYLLDHTLYFGKMRDEYSSDLISIYSYLNSSLSYLYPDLYGRNYGGGAVGFMVYEVQNIPVPNPEIIRPYYEELMKIMKEMENRKIGSVFEEIWDMKREFSLECVKKDRLELDRTILKALGFKDPDKFLFSYYPSVVKIVKERLDKAKSMPKKNKTEKVSLSKVADDIIKHLNIKKFPDDYITDISSTLSLKQGTKISYRRDLEGFYVSIDSEKYHYENQDKAKYVYYCALRGLTNIRIPTNIQSVLNSFEEDMKIWEKQLRNEIDNLTDDNNYKKKLISICSKKINYPILAENLR